MLGDLSRRYVVCFDRFLLGCTWQRLRTSAMCPIVEIRSVFVVVAWWDPVLADFTRQVEGQIQPAPTRRYVARFNLCLLSSTWQRELTFVHCSTVEIRSVFVVVAWWDQVLAASTRQKLVLIHPSQSRRYVAGFDRFLLGCTQK
jgi:hypothetical protein